LKRVELCKSALSLAGLPWLALLLLVITPYNCLFAQSQETVTVFFDSDTNSISKESKEALNSTADSLKNSDEYTITLEGYSDITGRADYNLQLSNKRAQLVKDYIVERGLSSSKIKVAGMGGTEKFGAGETNEALQANRRVNVIVDIPYVAAIEIESEEIAEVKPTEEPEVTEKPKPTQEPEVTEEPEATEAPRVEDAQIQSPSQGIPRNIEKEVRRSASKGVVFITPGEMEVGQTYTVEAEVSNDFLDALSGELPDIDLENKIGLHLNGTRFDINAELENGRNIKTVTAEQQARWEWYVTPLSKGYNSLTLSILVNPSSPGNGALNHEYDTFQRVIDVKPNLIHSVTSSYWIMGVLIVLIISIVFWILRKFRFN
jgi:hypothetical protein